VKSQNPSFTEELLQTLRRVGLPIFLLFIVGTSLDQWITNEMHDLIAGPLGVSPWIWGYGICSILVSILIPIIALLWVVRNRVTMNDYSQVIIESLRAWGKVITWSLLFVIPGLIKWLRLSFVPFIVLESPAYQRGELDALETSARLSKGQMFKLAGLLLFFSGVFPMILTNWDEYKTIWKTPLPSLGLSLIDSGLTVIFLLILKRIFHQTLKNPNDSASPDVLESASTFLQRPESL
jgi:hypothetical protein